MILPQLVAVLFITRNASDGTAEHLEVDLFQPVTTAVLFGLIASTPVHQSDAQQMVSEPKLNNSLGDIANISDREQSASNRFGPPRLLDSLMAFPGAFLSNDSTINTEWVTNTRLFKTTCCLPPNSVGNDKHLDTIFEVLKLAGHQCDSSRMRKVDKEAPELHPLAAPDRYHIHLAMMRQQCDAFVERVGMHSLLAVSFTYTLPASFHRKSPSIRKYC